MDSPLKVLGIAGSLRKASYNRAALKAATTLMPANATLDVFDLVDLPGFNQDHEKNPPVQVTTLKSQVRAADAILFVTPEYNYSIPGVLKNTIDWVSRPYGDNAWAGKPVAVMGASIGALGSARAQYHLRQCFVFLDMHAINQPEVMISHAAQKFDDAGNLKDDVAKDLIRKLLANLCTLARSRQSAS
jgi:chromate reductase